MFSSNLAERSATDQQPGSELINREVKSQLRSTIVQPNHCEQGIGNRKEVVYYHSQDNIAYFIPNGF